MKKLILTLAVAAMVCCAAAPDAIAATTAAAVTAQASATTVQVVAINGHARIKKSATVENTSDGLMVTCGGQTYRAVPSNRSDFQYMFTTRTTTWYFNY